MTALISAFKRDPRLLLRYAYILATLIIILIVVPKQQKFKYDFEIGRPWAYESLYAPFEFPIKKTEEQIEEQKKDLSSRFEPYYAKSPEVRAKAKKSFQEALEERFTNSSEMDFKTMDRLANNGEAILDDIYDQGIIDLDARHQNRTSFPRVKVYVNKVEESRNVSEFLTLSAAKLMAEKRTKALPSEEQNILLRAVTYGLSPDIGFDATLTEKRMQAFLEQNLLPDKGLVEAGELILSKGTIITPENYQKLLSLKEGYLRLYKTESQFYFLGGYVLLIICIFLVYVGYIQLFQKELIKNAKSILLLLVNILLFVMISSYVVGNEAISVYAIPFCIVPIIIIGFFDYKTALITHIMVILLVGSFVPYNAEEFIFIQLVAGFTAILTMMRIRYLSDFFLSCSVILLAYVVGYSGFHLMSIGSWAEFELSSYLWLGANFVLTLLAYPLIYANEKIFGFLSDITLVELSDINKKLLRQLSLKAPGTFQHSLQVANLSESVIGIIGGNALLVRVGALYHDIGKMKRPEFFIENQRYIENPHTDLNEEESAGIIIDHVNDGLEIAKQSQLPQKIIDFISSHHGDSRVEYFYRNYLKKTAESEVDESKFRYPGPRPKTLEQAVVMICDSVEAASRSLPQKSSDSLAKLIDGIIDGKIKDGQLAQAEISLRSINQMRNKLKLLLNDMYHVRIEYPDEQEPAEKPS